MCLGLPSTSHPFRKHLVSGPQQQPMAGLIGRGLGERVVAGLYRTGKVRWEPIRSEKDGEKI